jgi:hypothetical protein
MYIYKPVIRINAKRREQRRLARIERQKQKALEKANKNSNMVD